MYYYVMWIEKYEIYLMCSLLQKFVDTIMREKWISLKIAYFHIQNQHLHLHLMADSARVILWCWFCTNNPQNEFNVSSDDSIQMASFSLCRPR